MALPLLAGIGKIISGIAVGTAKGLTVAAKATAKGAAVTAKATARGASAAAKGAARAARSAGKASGKIFRSTKKMVKRGKKIKKIKKSLSKTNKKDKKSTRMTSEKIRKKLLDRQKQLKKINSNNNKLEKDELQAEKQKESRKKLKSNLKSIGSKISSPIKNIVGGIGEAIPLLIAGIVVNSIQGIIKSIKEFYEKNLKPKIEFFQKKLTQLNNFISNFDSDRDKINKVRGKLDKERNDLKTVISDNKIKENLDELSRVTGGEKYKKLSKENQDQIFKENIIKVSKNREPDISDMNIKRNNSFDENFKPISFSSDVNLDLSKMFDEDIFDENQNQILIINRPYQVV